MHLHAVTQMFRRVVALTGVYSSGYQIKLFGYEGDMLVNNCQPRQPASPPQSDVDATSCFLRNLRIRMVMMKLFLAYF